MFLLYFQHYDKILWYISVFFTLYESVCLMAELDQSSLDGTDTKLNDVTAVIIICLMTNLLLFHVSVMVKHFTWRMIF